MPSDILRTEAWFTGWWIVDRGHMENHVQRGCLMQPNELFYSEKQRFRQWWLWLLILILSPIGPVVFLWAIFQQVIIGSPIGNNPTSDCVLIILGLIFVIGFGIGIPFLMYTTDLIRR